MSAVGQANAFLSSLARLGFVALAGAGGWLGWRVWHADAEHAREKAELTARLEAKQKELDRLALAMKLLKVERRVARVLVLDQTPAKPGGRMTTRVRFEELDPDGDPVGEPKEFTIDGDLLYVDAQVVKFADVYVEQGDPLRSASLIRFTRAFGEHQAPSDGVSLDREGGRPDVYGGDAGLSALEKEVWGDFWELANDPARAELLGVRAAHGEAPSMRLRKGGVYTLTVRASGGFSFVRDSTSGSN